MTRAPPHPARDRGARPRRDRAGVPAGACRPTRGTRGSLEVRAAGDGAAGRPHPSPDVRRARDRLRAATRAATFVRRDVGRSCWVARAPSRPCVLRLPAAPGPPRALRPSGGPSASTWPPCGCRSPSPTGQGGLRRVDLITAGEADATVLSHAAAVRLDDGSGGGVGWCDLGEDTYYAPGAIVVLRRTADPPPQDPLRVGIDLGIVRPRAPHRGRVPARAGAPLRAVRFPGHARGCARGARRRGHLAPGAAGSSRPSSQASRSTRSGGRARSTRAGKPSGAVVLFGTPRPEVAVVCRGLDGARVRARQEELLALDPSDPRLAERYWLR